MKKKAFFFVLMLGILIPHLYSQSLYKGYIFEIGGSYSWVSYTDEIDDMMYLVNDKRTTFAVEGSFGSELFRKFYIVGSGSCLFDLFRHSNSSLNIIIPFIGFGVRYYPFNKFLQLGLDNGLTWIDFKSNINNIKTSDRSFGYGLKASIAIDFNIDLMPGFNYTISFIDSEIPHNWGIFIKIINKY